MKVLVPRPLIAIVVGLGGFLLALILPTPILLLVAGGWLARHGWQWSRPPKQPPS